MMNRSTRRYLNRDPRIQELTQRWAKELSELTLQHVDEMLEQGDKPTAVSRKPFVDKGLELGHELQRVLRELELEHERKLTVRIR